MSQKCHMTDPNNEIRALALAYVQSQNISGMRPEAVLNLYNETLGKMHDFYEKNLQ